MSRHHYVHTSNTDNIKHDLKHLPTEDFETLYGIIIRENGSVYDTVLDKSFSNINEWIAIQSEEDEWDENTHTHQNSRKYANDDF